MERTRQNGRWSALGEDMEHMYGREGGQEIIRSGRMRPKSP